MVVMPSQMRYAADHGQDGEGQRDPAGQGTHAGPATMPQVQQTEQAQIGMAVSCRGRLSVHLYRSHTVCRGFLCVWLGELLQVGIHRIGTSTGTATGTSTGRCRRFAMGVY